VILSDPGISLADASLGALGPEPVRRRERRREAERVAYPRLAALGTIALLLAIITPRIERGKRKLLWLTAAAPAALFAIDGTLAVRRTLSEAYAVAPTASREPWRDAEQHALQAEREEHWAQAQDLWARAIAAGRPAGGSAGPIYYQLGLRARERGDLVKARADFARALSAHPPAPGAAKELATLDAAEQKFELAQQELEHYIALAGADPDTLTLLAVLKTNLGKSAAGVAAVQQARDLVGDEAWRGAELEAQVRARAGDAAGAVAALRRLEAEGRLNRAALRADAAYLSIANDPAWVAFINEKPTPAPASRVTPSRRREASDK
jgi:tetratricopeptide (TPR) repeat protein